MVPRTGRRESQIVVRVNRIFRIIVRGVLALALFVVVFALFLQPLANGWWVRHQLMKALDHASSVQVVEHSSRVDSIEHMNDPNYKDITYATVTLTRRR